MSREIIALGIRPNDGKGDPLRTAFDKINRNFVSLYDTVPSVGQSPEIIRTGSDANDGTGDTLISAFEKVNVNFKTLFRELPEAKIQLLDPFQPNPAGGNPIRTAFERINSNFESLFQIAIPATTVEIIAPSEQNASSTESTVALSGPINITNNIYITTPPSNTPALTADPVPSTTPYAVPYGPYGAQEYINIGAQPNDGTGDPLRVAFGKINNNFSNLFYTTTNTYSAYSEGTVSNQVILEIPVSAFSQGTFQIRSTSTTNPDSQGITITAQLTPNNSGVKFTGYGTTFSGNCLTRYSMDVLSSNVRLMVDPLVPDVILHFISSQVTFIGLSPTGTDIGLDGYINSVMSTQDELNIETEF